MKIFSALILMMMLSLVSCGGKSGGGGGNTSGVFSNAITTQEGTLEYSTGTLTFGGRPYTKQAYIQYPGNVDKVNNAVMLAQRSNILPQNGIYRVRMTAQDLSTTSYVTGGYNAGYTSGYGYPNTTTGMNSGTYGQSTLVINNIVVIY